MEGQGPTIDRQSIEEASREANERALEFNPAVRAQAIRAMLRDVVPLVRRGVPEAELKTTFAEAAEQFPELFKKILAKEDLTPLNSMLAMLDKMAEGSMNQHQASIIVGKKLVDRFVKPQLSGREPDTQER